jgi:hypothetical protein
MGTREIVSWKLAVAENKHIFVCQDVKAIHPVVDKIVKQLLEIDLIPYIRVAPEDRHASNEIKDKKFNIKEIE